jgi:hypothetical protein
LRIRKSKGLNNIATISQDYPKQRGTDWIIYM